MLPRLKRLEDELLIQRARAKRADIRWEMEKDTAALIEREVACERIAEIQAEIEEIIEKS